MNNLYIFDCFGVTLCDVSKLWMDKHFDADTQKKIRAQIFRKIDCGQMLLDQAFDTFAEMCNIDKQQVYNEWAACAYPLTDTLLVIEKIKAQGGTVALLSNSDESDIQRLFTRFDLYKYFDKVFVSAHYKCAKPDLQLYRICLDSFTEKFDKIYFTDDNPDNLVGLSDLGITPILFTDAKTLEKDLNLH